MPDYSMGRIVRGQQYIKIEAPREHWAALLASKIVYTDEDEINDRLTDQLIEEITHAVRSTDDRA